MHDRHKIIGRFPGRHRHAIDGVFRVGVGRAVAGGGKARPLRLPVHRRMLDHHAVGVAQVAVAVLVFDLRPLDVAEGVPLNRLEVARPARFQVGLARHGRVGHDQESVAQDGAVQGADIALLRPVGPLPHLIDGRDQSLVVGHDGQGAARRLRPRFQRPAPNVGLPEVGVLAQRVAQAACLLVQPVRLRVVAQIGGEHVIGRIQPKRPVAVVTVQPPAREGNAARLRVGLQKCLVCGHDASS